MPMPRGRAILSAFFGLLALIVGGLIVVGWVTRTVGLVQVVPGMVAAVIGSGLCLALGGLAFILLAWNGLRWAAWLGLPMISLAALALFQSITGHDLALDLPAFHDWMHDFNPHPGRMASNTALAFLMVGLGLLTERCAEPGLWARRIRRLSVAVSLLLGVTGLLPHLVYPEMLFGWHGNMTRMSPFTCVGILLLAMAGRVRWQSAAAVREGGDDVDDAPQRHRRGIFKTAAIVLTVVVVITATAGFAWQLKSVTENAQEHLSRSLNDRRLVLQEALATARMNMEQSAVSPVLVEAVSKADLRALSIFTASMLANGFSHVEIDGLDGPLNSAGTAVAQAALEVPLKPSGELAWQNGHVVRHVQAIRGSLGVVGYLRTEQVLKVQSLLTAEVAQWGQSFEMALCAEHDVQQIVCFPQRLRPHWFVTNKVVQGQPLPMSLALNGMSGVTTRLDFRQHQVVAAYAPVGDTGLGMVLKLDSEELYAPARRQFLLALPALGLIVLAGLWVLRWRLRPLVRELVATRERAQANEARFIAAMESSLDAFYILRAERDPQGLITDFRFTYVTMRGAALMSSTPADVEGQLLCELMPVNRTAGFFDQYKTVIETGLPLAEEFSIDQPGLLATWISHQVVKLGDDSIAITSRDVSESKHAQEAVRESEALLSLITGSVPALIAYLSAEDERYIFINRAGAELYGKTVEEVVGKTILEVVGPDNYRLMKSPLATVQSGHQVSYEREVVRADGNRHVMSSYLPHRDSHGRLFFCALSNDITARKQMEAALAISQERLTLALESSHLALFDCNFVTHQVFHSAHWSSMLGGPAQEVTNRMDELLKLVHPDDLPGVMDKALRTMKGQTAFYIAEHRVRTLSGEWLWICSRARVVERDASGRTLRVSGTNADITEQKRLEAQLQHMAEMDSLTGLPNRALFNDRLTRALNRLRRHGGVMALMALDIDFFKAINDGFGHDAGDAVLQEFARRLQATVRLTDTVARLGGDEFTVILEGLRSASEADLVASKVVASMQDEFVHAGQSIPFTASVGVACIHEVVDGAALIKLADQALYRAKAAGRNTYCT